MDVFKNPSEENSFLHHLHLLSFNKEIENTFNLICEMCKKSFFTNIVGTGVCKECRDHIQELIEEFNNDC